MEKINEFLDDRKKGPLSGLLATAFGASMILIACILHSLAGPFNIFTHWISNLGVGPFGSNYVFNIGLFIEGFAYIPFFLSFVKFLWVKKGEKLALVRNIGTSIGLVFAFLALLGLILVTIFPMYLHLIYGHGAGALIFFSSASIFSVIFTLSIIINKKWSKWHIFVILGSLCVIITLAMLVFNATLIPGGADIFLFIEAGTPSWMRFWEWMYMYAILTYIALTCVFVLKHE